MSEVNTVDNIKDHITVMNVDIKLIHNLGPMTKLSFRCTDNSAGQGSNVHDENADPSKLAFVMLRKNWVHDQTQNQKLSNRSNCTNIVIPCFKDKDGKEPTKLAVTYYRKDGTKQGCEMQPDEFKKAFNATRGEKRAAVSREQTVSEEVNFDFFNF